MENKNKTLVAVQGTAKHTNPIKRFFSVLKAKRKKAALAITTAFAMQVATMMSAFAASNSNVDTTAGEAEFNTLIGFFALWIGRIGMVVGFVGAVMFGLAVKNDESDAKTRGLMTMASGFIVFAVTKSLNLFGISVSII